MWPDPSEDFVRERITAGSERGKLDFKKDIHLESKRDRAELARLIAAMANTDSELYDNYGYIILGAERRSLTGGIDALQSDSFSSNLQQQINAYLDPPVPFEVKAFSDSEKGWYGVIIIPPSSPYQRPHFISREYSDAGFTIRPGQCYVRIGDRINIAQKSDYERMYHARFSAEIADARQEIARMRVRTPVLDVNVEHRVAMGQFGLTKYLYRQIEPINEISLNQVVEQERQRLMQNLTWAQTKGSTTPNEVQQYLQEVQLYLEEYRLYYPRAIEYNNLLDRSIIVAPILTNDSYILAENVIVLFHVHPDLSVSDAATMSGPEPPKHPQIRGIEVYIGHATAGPLLGISADQNMGSDIEGPIIQRGYAYQIMYKVKTVQNPLQQRLPPFAIHLPANQGQESTTYQLLYTIYARDMEPSQSELTISIEYTPHPDT